MPNIALKTNVSVSKEAELSLKAKFGDAISLLSGKSEAWLMLSIEDNCRMYFRGDSSKPLAFLQVQVLGKIDYSQSCRLSERICGILKDELDISPDCTYIKYEEVDYWGFNSSNF